MLNIKTEPPDEALRVDGLATRYLPSRIVNGSSWNPADVRRRAKISFS